MTDAAWIRPAYMTDAAWRSYQIRRLIAWALEALEVAEGWGPGSVFELDPALEGDLLGKVFRWREELRELEEVLDQEAEARNLEAARYFADLEAGFRLGYGGEGVA